MTKVSIIVPIYNVEKYLKRCIDTILNQTLKDIEIILATDGGEECDEICRNYAKQDKKVTLVMHPGSYGKAFNKSLKIAKGEYIGIVEADDWCDPFMYEKLYSRAIETKADVVKGGFYFTFDDPERNFSVLYDGYMENFSLLDRPDFLSSQPAVWSCIYNKKFLLQNKIFMMEERLPFIDVPFHYETLFMAKNYQLLKEPLYFYYQDNPEQSVRNVKPLAGITTEKKAYEILFQKTKLYDVLKEGLIYATACHLRWNYGRLAPKDIKVFWNAAHEFLKSLPLEDIQYTFFYPEDKKFFLSILNNTYTMWRLKRNLKKILSIQSSNTHKQLCILGVKIKIKKNTNVKNSIQKIFSVKNSKNKTRKIITVLGIKLKIKNYRRIGKNKRKEAENVKAQILENARKLSNIEQSLSHKDEILTSLEKNVKAQIVENTQKLNNIEQFLSSKNALFISLKEKNKQLETNLNNQTCKIQKFINNIDAEKKDILDDYTIEDNTSLYDENFYKINAKESYESARLVIDIFKKYYNPHSVIDLGCGVGTWLKAWQENGANEILGVDANQMPENMLYISRKNLHVVDFENSSFNVDKKYDLAQSLECLEHISPQNEDKILSILYKASDLVLFSAAIPMQVGTNHINCHKLQYWVDKFKDKGYKCYDIIRPECIKKNIKIGSWYMQNILVFAKDEKAQILEEKGAIPIEKPVLFYHSEILKDILTLL